MERTLGRKPLEIEIPKKRRRGVRCCEVHSQGQELLVQGYAATVVAAWSGGYDEKNGFV